MDIFSIASVLPLENEFSAVKYIFLIPFVLILIKISYDDYLSYLISDKLLIFLLVYGGLYQFLLHGCFLLFDIFFAVLFISIVFLPIYFFTDSIGGGDVKLCYALCVWLPYPLIAQMVFLAAFSGAAAGLYMMLKNKNGLKQIMPFGPFLSFAALLLFICFAL